MIGKQALEAAGIAFTDEQAAAAEKVILNFAVKDIADLHQRMEHLVGLRLVDAIADPNVNASLVNAAMRWLDRNNPKDDKADTNPMQAAIENAKKAMQEGGKLPPIDEYAEDQR